MTFIITAVFKATIGLLVNKAIDAAAERLKEGDVTDQKFRGLIVREIQELKSKLDGLSRKDLLAAVDFFEVGLRYLYKSIDGKRSVEVSLDTPGASRENFEEVSLPSNAVKTVSLAKEMTNMQLAKLDETARSALSDAKERFKMAREKATEASNNEALSVFDRIAAIRYRVMATMLESAVGTVGTASDLAALSVKSALENALPECEHCLLRLNSLPAVQSSFKVEFQRKGLSIRCWFSKDQRMEIISSVCQVNRAIYDAMQTVGKDVHLCVWPFVDTGEDKVDPLRDGRVTKALRKVGMEHCCVTPWSFCYKGEEKHKLTFPVGMTVNTHGHFLIADKEDRTVKVFDSRGNFFRSLNPKADDADTLLGDVFDVFDVACDADNNTYVLVGLWKPGDVYHDMEVQIYDDTGDHQHKLHVGKGFFGSRKRLAVNDSKVLVLKGSFLDAYDEVKVYKQYGGYVCCFGKGVLKNAIDIAAAYDGRILVADTAGVHLFTMEGQQISKFNINIEGAVNNVRTVSHTEGEHVVVAGIDGTDRLRITIYTYHGEIVRLVQLDDENAFHKLTAITITKEERIAVAVRDRHEPFYKVIVV